MQGEIPPDINPMGQQNHSPMDLDIEPAPPYEPNPDFIPNSSTTTTANPALTATNNAIQRSRNNSDSIQLGSSNMRSGSHSHNNSLDSTLIPDHHLHHPNYTSDSGHVPKITTNLEDSNILYGLMSKATNNLNKQRRKFKILGLKRLNPIQHLAVALCRDVSLIVIIKYLYILLKEYYHLTKSSSSPTNFDYDSITSVRASEIFMAAVWCIVSGYLSYSVLDDLMLRWIVMYDTTAVLIRMLSMSLFIIFLIELLLFIISNENQMQEFFYSLPAWITISCVLTLVFIVQNFVTSNLRIDQLLLDELSPPESSSATIATESSDTPLHGNESRTVSASDLRISDSLNSADDYNLNNNNNSNNNFNTHTNGGLSRSTSMSKKKKVKKVPRSVDLYNITVFAVVPIGIASFITMIVLIRLVIILRLDIDYTGLTKAVAIVDHPHHVPLNQ